MLRPADDAVSRFRFVDDHCRAYGVKRLCEFVETSRAGYYQWRLRQHDPGPRACRDGQLFALIRQIHVGSRCTYGAPRVHGQPRRRGGRTVHKRVPRLVLMDGLVDVQGRRNWPNGKTGAAPTLDMLERDFTAERPNTRWVADMTEFTTDKGRYYLAGVKELSTKEFIGWAGSPYLSLAFDVAAGVHGLRSAYRTVGDCFDNAAMESFWAALKREFAWLRGSPHFGRGREARNYLFEFIEAFYKAPAPSERPSRPDSERGPQRFLGGHRMAATTKELTEAPWLSARVKTSTQTVSQPSVTDRCLGVGMLDDRELERVAQREMIEVLTAEMLRLGTQAIK